MEKKELLEIVGGINITGTLLGNIYKLVNSVMDVGSSLVSAFRRIIGVTICPL